MTTERVQPHLDNVQKAWWAWITGPFPSPPETQVTEQRSDASTAGVMTNRTELPFLGLSLVNAHSPGEVTGWKMPWLLKKPLRLQLSGSSPVPGKYMVLFYHPQSTPDSIIVAACFFSLTV
ncbi:hypothetical protein [Tengunoibacter tsumagoiensis]|uniref:hypothetical protein n=1 Tax=Tengunoibacter tsumagoiensis TaxID=2014871 RepID=UPI000F8472E7|nr:hypothetical protein [Tengunoibacter tsumagoiensis]